LLGAKEQRKKGMVMIRFALFGCGRIGRMHADNISSRAKAELVWAYDVDLEAARAVAARHGCRAGRSVEEVLSDGSVDAVLIASSTDTHVALITAAARAGKAILCEKPIDLDIARVDTCWKEVDRLGVPIQIGFNRRYDPSFSAVRKAIRAGEIGELRQVIITSRDPEIPPVAYMKVAGGLLRDMTIHDFDLARFLLGPGEEPVEVTAFVNALIDPEVKALGDHDTAMILLRTASGKQCCINNYRQASYGYDQRIEVIGEKGMLKAENRRATTVERWNRERTAAQDPLLYFFIERYREAYVLEIDDFIDALETGRPCDPGFEAGRRALLLANAAYESARTGQIVRLAQG
jgi:myo-inositol 2-dehydrogenase/D-chiro-inositol 1-dehydrogenase